MATLDLKYIRLFRNCIRLKYPFNEEEVAPDHEQQVQRVMEEYNQPGEKRLYMLKWLIEKYEKGILQDPDVAILGHGEIQVIQNALDQLCVPYESFSAIEGVAGSNHSITVLVELSERVIHAQSDENTGLYGLPEEIKVPEASRIVDKSLKLLKYIADHRD